MRLTVVAVIPASPNSASRVSPRNIGASVRQRLLNLAHARVQPMELLLTRYALERLLHRLSLSPHRERFVLKGAMLLATWFDEPHRATRDVDLLGFGDPTHDALLVTFREVMATEADDGVSFDLKGLRIEAIREEVEYGGSRLRTSATLAGARIPITVDIGFGDAVEPGVEDIDLPVLLDMPSPHLRAYPPETVIAEKFHAMVVLGRANSRMKDYCRPNSELKMLFAAITPFDSKNSVSLVCCAPYPQPR